MSPSWRAEDLVWPLPPACGVLGPALVWHLPDPAAAPSTPAAQTALRRRLELWTIPEPVIRAAEQVVAELLVSAARYGSGPLFLELARSRPFIALAVRQRTHTGWARPAPSCISDRDLHRAAALAGVLHVRRLPDHTGYAFTTMLQHIPAPQGRDTMNHVLTAQDRCDRCGARAYIRARFSHNRELLFCPTTATATRQHWNTGSPNSTTKPTASPPPGPKLPQPPTSRITRLKHLHRRNRPPGCPGQGIGRFLNESVRQ